MVFSLQGCSDTEMDEITTQFQFAFEDYWKQHANDYLDSNNIVVTYITAESFGMCLVSVYYTYFNSILSIFVIYICNIVFYDPKNDTNVNKYWYVTLIV